MVIKGDTRSLDNGSCCGVYRCWMQRFRGVRGDAFFRFLRHLDLGCSEKQRSGPLNFEKLPFISSSYKVASCFAFLLNGNSGRRVGPCPRMPSSRYSLDGAPSV